MKNNLQAANKSLNTASTFWFVITAIGQFIFALYVIMLYGKSGVEGNFQNWNKAVPNGYHQNDILGNIIFGIHLALAAVITIGGPLQLIPNIRQRTPKFHRILGRIYIVSAFIIALAGLYLTWVRGGVGDTFSALFISGNAIIIMACAFNAIKYAVARNIRVHNQWALRLFVAVSGVYFFRIGLMLWLAIFRRPVGFDPETFSGPFLIGLGIVVYILPVFFVELYLRAKNGKSIVFKIALTIFLILLTLGMAVGILSAVKGMWLPRLRS
ncbi:MAG: DUF2306 domain-containing protein [Sediminibacterium sp.]